jgi:hypothetical protein
VIGDGVDVPGTTLIIGGRLRSIRVFMSQRCNFATLDPRPSSKHEPLEPQNGKIASADCNFAICMMPKMLLQIVAGQIADRRRPDSDAPSRGEGGRSIVSRPVAFTRPSVWVRHPRDDPNNLIIVDNTHPDRMFEMQEMRDHPDSFWVLVPHVRFVR